MSLKHFVRALQPPIFDDLDQNYKGRILYRSLWLTVLGVLPAFLFAAKEAWHVGTVVVYFVFLVFLGVMLKRGYIQLTVVLLVMSLWTLMTLDVIMADGILGVGYTGYLLPIVIASFTLGWEFGLGHALLSSFTGFVLLITDRTGNPPIGEWYFHSFCFFGAVYTIYIIDKVWQKSRLRAGRNAEALIIQRQELAHEIDERVSVESALHQSRDLLQAFVRSLPDIAFIIDDEGRYVDVLGNHNNVIYTDPESMVGLRFHDVLPDSSVADKFLRTIHQALATNETQRLEYNLKTDSGARWFEGYISAMPGETSMARKVVWVSRDISERKHLEQTRLKSEKAYVKMESQKEIFALRHDFISSVSHEFRTPLAVILSSKEILDLYYERMTPQQRSDHLQKIEDHVRFMVNMVDKLSFVNKASAGLLKVTPEPVALPELCQEMVDHAQAEANDQHDLSLTMVDPPPLIYADSSLLRQMLSNMLSNAIKYSPQGGPIRFTLTQQDGYVVFRIQDQGIGILPDDMKRLYEPFFRGANVQDISGTGLGLTIVEHAIELHCGTLNCESQPEQGTTFTIRLPLDLRQNYA